MAKTTDPHVLRDLLRKHLIPPLKPSFHKGEAGRIGVIGGCFEYTGAPYYAAISSLHVGADLSMVFCSSSAATAIKSYSPELMVYPVFQEELEGADDGDTNSNSNSNNQKREQFVQKTTKKVSDMFPRLHVLIIGPGLGRYPLISDCTRSIIQEAKKKEIPMLFDGDGLYLLSQDPTLVQGYNKAVLTPNAVEFGRLYEAVCKKKLESSSSSSSSDNDNNNDEEHIERLKELCNALGNVTIVKKGNKDYISNGNDVEVCAEEGSLRRQGGQGDVLSGLIGTFIHWYYWAQKRSDNKAPVNIVQAAYGACVLLKACARSAFQKHGRGVTTPDIIKEIGPVFMSIYGDEEGEDKRTSSWLNSKLCNE